MCLQAQNAYAAELISNESKVERNGRMVSKAEWKGEDGVKERGMEVLTNTECSIEAANEVS